MTKPTSTLSLYAPFVLPLYVPSLCLSILLGTQNLIVPLYLSEQNYSFQQIGIATGAFFFGMMIGELPSGVLLGRMSARKAMVGGTLLIALGSFAILTVTSLWAFIALRLVSGFGLSCFGLARHSFVTGATENATRGKIMTWLGGMSRFGKVTGPLIGGVLATRFGLASGFGFIGVVALLGSLLVLAFTPKQEKTANSAEEPFVQDLALILRERQQVLTTIGAGLFFMQLIRNAPRTIIPLYGQSLGLSYDVIGLIETIGGACDTALFWSSGWIMDKFGRKFAIIPSILLQSMGLLLIPFTGGFAGLAFVNMLSGLGNAISSGSMMTLASDLAPTKGRTAFLSLYRLAGDFGVSVAPSLVGIIAGAFVLGSSGVAIGLFGLVGAGFFIRFVPETLNKPVSRL